MSSDTPTDAVIALGSNLGNRALNMHRALKGLRKHGVQILRHSALYETAAAYVTNQPSFLNAAVLARTSLPPRELLKVLKRLELEAGRDLSSSAQRYGPRPLDLDILFHGSGTHMDERVEVPHPRWRERPFVLAPCADLLYRRDDIQHRPDDPHHHSASASASAPTSAATPGGSPAAGAPSGARQPGAGAGAEQVDAAREPFPMGHASVLGYLRTAKRLWEASGAKVAAVPASPPPAQPAYTTHPPGGSGPLGAPAASGGGGFRGVGVSSSHSSGVGVRVHTLTGGEVMRRVTPLVNMVGEAGEQPQHSHAYAGSEVHQLQVAVRPQPPAAAAASANSGSGAAGPSGGGGGDSGGGGQAAEATHGSEVLLPWGTRTYLMAVLNITPDSFSDGGRYFTGEGAAGEQQVPVAEVVAAAERMVAEGADLLDVGGQSTRPGAHRLSAQQELARVIPVIQALRASPALRHVPISIDTFYAEVARQAVAAGANVVNDVSGGGMDPHMGDTVAELGVPFVVMHMRGDPGTMTRAEHTHYGSGPGAVWRGVGAELQRAAERAEAAGVPAWNIILDPGIGFAKDAAGNVELLRHLGDLRSQALEGPYAAAGPLLLGPSRKRFLGALTGRQAPAERDAATAAACVVGVAGGADMVRVHAVRDVRDALRVADAVYRRG